MSIRLPYPLGSQVTAECLSELPEFQKLEHEWRDLFAAAPSACSFLKWEWISEWWKAFGAVYGAAPGGLRVIAVRDGASLAGVLPLYFNARSGQLGFIGTGEESHEVAYPEYLDYLYLPGHALQCRKAFQNALYGPKEFYWDRFYSGLMRADAELKAVLDGDDAPPLVRRLAKTTVHTAPGVRLDGGFEKYLAELSSNSRQQFRRLLRQSDGQVRFRAAETVAEALEFFEQLVALHQKSWAQRGLTGAFSSERFVGFHRRLIERLLPLGEVVIARLGGAEGEPSAVLYGFITRDKFDFYQSGVEFDSKIRSDGITAHLLLMRHLAGAGIVKYDFLAGDAEYKTRLANYYQPLDELILTRPRLQLVPELAARAFRKAGRGLASLFARGLAPRAA